MRLALAATEFVEVPIVVAEDPTGSAVELAIVDVWAAPTDADWVAGDWDPASTSSPYTARVLVGPDGDLELEARGWRAVYWRVLDDPEVPVRSAGLVFAW
jgi:hypothetical protein